METLPFKRTALISGIATAFLCGAPQAATPVSGEFRVNTFTANYQRLASIAIDADGDFVVAWNSYPQDGSSYGIYAQRYNASGAAQGGEFRVNTLTTSSQITPSVAMDADGDFVVAWSSSAQDGSNYGIYAQRYNAVGVAQGSEFRVNTFTTNQQVEPSIALDADGDFVVAWTSVSQDGSYEGVYAQRYSAAGVAQGGEFLVNTLTTNIQRNPSVAIDADGDFVVAWQSYLQDGSGYGVYAKRYSAAGLTRGSEFRVNTATTNQQRNPSVAIDADGDFVVAWESNVQDGSSYGIYAQRYNAAGVAQGVEFRANTFTTNRQRSPSVALDADGDFVIAWQSYSQDGSADGVYARRYNAAGVADGAEFGVNTFTNSSQALPNVALDADGDFVVAWQSYGQDGSLYGVYARRYRSPDPIDLTLTQFDSADPVVQGAPLTYSLSVANLQPPNDGSATGFAAIDSALGAASQVRITSTLPTGTTFNSISGTGWTCSLATPALNCNLASTLLAGQDSTLNINLAAPSSPGVIQHAARVHAAQFDPQTANNRTTESTQVVCAASVIQFSAASFSAAEDAATLTVTATRSGGSCGAASVKYDSASGSALPGLDFVDVTGTLSWIAGELGSKSFTVPLLDDSLDEIDEKFPLALSNPVNAQLGTVSGISGIITDNDVSPRVNFTSSAQTAAEPGALVTVSAQISELSGRNVVIPITRSGTAMSGSDYFANATSLTIPAGQRNVSFDVEVLDDALSESTETAIFGMGSPTGATVGSLNTHTLSITDNDVSVPTVSFTAATATGSESQNRDAIVSLSAASASTIMVPFSISGTAANPADYSLNRSSPLSFPPGTTSITIRSTPVDDAIDEPDESVILTLGTPTNATLGATTVHTRTIVDNDP